MHITLSNMGKRFNREWIFRHIDYQFKQGIKYAVTGPNGSGKSTLLQVIAGSMTFNEGSINFTSTPLEVNKEKALSPSELYKNISIATPYLDLVEEMSALEFLQFHARFKTFLPSLSIHDIAIKVGLEASLSKQIRYYSSGMKQRLKLAQAFFSNTEVLLLDEPTTNLDADGLILYHQLIKDFTKERIVVISSNDKQEYSFCEEIIDINHYK